MDLTTWITLVAGAGQAMVAVLAWRARGPLGVPLALFGADLAVWSFAEVAYALSEHPAWLLLDHAASPFTVALGLHFVLAFVGRRRALRALLGGAYASSALLAGVALVELLPALRFHRAPEGTLWATLLLADTAAVTALASWLLVSHLRATTSVDERARTRLLILALPLAAVFGATDLVNNFATSIPNLSSAGTLACAALLSVVALRKRLFGRDLSTGVAIQAGALALIAIGGYFLVYRFFAASTAMLLVASASLSFGLLAVGRQVFAEAAAKRARVAELTRLGRISAQMAHDLRNPLAALKGATQFLQEERDQGRSLDEHGEFLDLIAEQAARLERLVGSYQHLARLEPAAAPADVADLVRRVVEAQSLAGEGTTIRLDADPALPRCALDPDLVARALENVVRNAFEATPSGGEVRVTVEHGAAGGVVVRVADRGAGMDARTLEAAFDEFFTTKATGSGLGLPFVRRVLEAHGGSVELRSRVGHGTVVELRLPQE